MLDTRSQGVSYVYLRVLRKRFTVSTVLANSTMFIVRGKFPPIRDVSVGTIKNVEIGRAQNVGVRARVGVVFAWCLLVCLCATAAFVPPCWLIHVCAGS